MADEDAIYTDNNVTITKALAKINNISYPINTIASVYVAKPQRIKNYIIGGVILVVAVLFFFNEVLLPFAIAGALGGVLVWSGWRMPYSLMLQTSAGSQTAYTSRDNAYLHKIKGAIEKAVAERG